MVGQWNASPRSRRTTRFLSGTLSQPRQPYGPRWMEVEEEEREAEGQIEGEVKRKVKGIERLRLEQVPLSGDGLPRCHDQTRVCTASTVLAEEQPGKLNFGWDGRRRKSGEEELYEGVDESTGVEQRGKRPRKMEERDVRFLAIHPFNRREECENKGSVLSSAVKRIWSGNTVGKQGRKRERENSVLDGIRGHIFLPPIRPDEIRRIRHKATA